MTYKRFTGRATDYYEIDEQAAEIVNLAIALERPILVEGEAGCGKTKLASALAEELELGDPISIPVKSTSQAKDLLYRFDALRRLQDVQDRENKEARYVYPYISLQPLGGAIQRAEPCVVLIDEVDKADIDFPNDLLDVLDRFEFDIEDLPEEESRTAKEQKGFGRRVSGAGGTKPIVVITSNREKQLPQPFLRRCLYLQLRFPEEPELLARIVRKNLDQSMKNISKELLGAAIERFLSVREVSREIGAQKKPATSELIDWVKVLYWNKKSPQQIHAGGKRPYHWRLLFKTMQDVQAYEARVRDADS